MAFEKRRLKKRTRRRRGRAAQLLESVFNYQWQFMPMMNPDGYWTSHQEDLPGEGRIKMKASYFNKTQHILNGDCISL